MAQLPYHPAWLRTMAPLSSFLDSGKLELMTHTQPLSLLSEEEQMLRDSVLAFAKKEVEPHVRKMDAQGAMRSEIVRGLFEMGVMGIEVPEQHGGAGASFFSAIVVVEALAEVDASVSVLLDVQNTLVLNTILRAGNEAQHQKYLPRLATEWVGSYALSEASSGSDALSLKTHAKKDGDDYLLTGSKLWITNAAESALFIIFANAAPEKGHKGITAFLVERGTAGFEVGSKEDKLGIRASSTCPLNLEEVRVGSENILGAVGDGYKIAMETLNEGRIGIGAQMLGIAQSALNMTLRHVQERQQFGKRLADFQGVQFQVAEMATELEAARLLVYHAARLKDAGMPFLKEAAMAKLQASNVAEKLSSMAVDLLGGVGFTKEYGAEKLYRDAKIGKIYEGTSNMQLLTIAKQIIAPPR